MAEGTQVLPGLLGFLFVLSIIHHSMATVSPSGVNYEVVALVTIKAALLDPDDVLDGWERNPIDPCGWRMVTCNPDGYVAALELPSQSLSGTMTPTIGNLSYLQTVLLQNNEISGPTPAEIRKLENLQALDLSDNMFSGDIPNSFGALLNLTYLQLNNNSLSGRCPLSLSNIQGLDSHKCGFGIVYKGRLHDGTIVAVKRLKDNYTSGCETQFQTEVEMISLAVHRNLLRLSGFCLTEKERLLVYPYMPNGSVASWLREHINGKTVLDWSRRKNIALGTARTLLYLHEQCEPKIIHIDVKAANILLDENFEAVVGDFGLAKLLDHGESHVTTAVRGTHGHIAPEYLSTGQSSEKTDVFGFGILLLELITGRRALDFGHATNQKGTMLDWLEEGKHRQLVDKLLRDNFGEVELENMAKVALSCTRHNPSERPRMSEVLKLLEDDRLSEKREASRTDDFPGSQSCDCPELRYVEAVEEYSLMEAMELSGPR